MKILILQLREHTMKDFLTFISQNVEYIFFAVIVLVVTILILIIRSAVKRHQIKKNSIFRQRKNQFKDSTRKKHKF